MRAYHHSCLGFLVLIWLQMSASLEAQSSGGEPYVVSEVVGNVIDAKEREHYGLFPEIEGFQSATFFKIGVGSYLIRITWIDAATGEQREKVLQRGEETIRSIREAIIRKQLEESSQEGVALKPPLETGRILPELLLGGAGTLVGSFLALSAISGESLEGGGSPSAWITTIALGSLGSSAGISIIGNSKEQSGSFLAAFLGSAAGGVVGALIGNAMENAIPLILLTPVGGTIGFNLSRQYEPSQNPRASQHNLKNHGRGLRFGLVALPAGESQNKLNFSIQVMINFQF